MKLLLEKQFPPVVEAECGDAGSAEGVTPPGQAGRGPNEGEEQLAASGDEPGDAEECRLWTRQGMEQFQQLAMPGWAGTRRKDLLRLLKELNRPDRAMDQAVKQAAEQHPQAQLLMTQPGVGPVTALAFVLTVGDVARFAGSKQLSYLGLVPSEQSSGNKRCLGASTKQGNRFLRKLLVEAAQITVRKDEGFRKEYQHRCHRRPKGVAKVAAARKLAVRLYWMLRSNVSYPEIARIESNPRVALEMLARDFDSVISHTDRSMQKTAQAPWKTPPIFPLPHKWAAGCPNRRIMIVVSVVSMVQVERSTGKVIPR